MQKTLNDLAEELVRACIIKQLKIAVAESCTGGLVSHLITKVPGASQIFQAGLVTYSNDSKQCILDISKDIIDKHGAVSSEVASLMASQLRLKVKADITVSITGIAGPGGGSAEKPVGTVYFGMSDGSSTKYKHSLFDGDRQSIQESSAKYVLQLFLARIQ